MASEAMAEQLTFDLPRQPALGRGDFFVSPGNAAAVEAIQGWHDWPQGKLVLFGPEGSGKTHLAHVWAALTGARLIASALLAEADVSDLAHTPLVVEDADRSAGDGDAEAALFHLHNLALERGLPLLLTARVPPARWRLDLPDLASRMQGSAIATLAAPDDALFSAVLVKLFADRQIAVDPNLVAWLTRRIDRSFAEAGRTVDALDRAALKEGKPITRSFAARVLDKLAN